MKQLALTLIALTGLSQTAPCTEVRKDIAYRNTSPRNTLDLYYPEKENRSYPTHIYIHGGGWTSGSKNLSGKQLQVFKRLADRGFLGVSVEYRTVDPQQNIYMRKSTIDTLDAVRYVFAHAGELGVDTSNVFVWGASAGGHLALMAATAIDNPHLSESPELASVPVHLQAAIVWLPPAI
jgi:acetyl esterase/lipase